MKKEIKILGKEKERERGLSLRGKKEKEGKKC